MTLFKPYKDLFLVLCLSFTLSQSYSQFSWDVRDPVDFGAVDFGDNKVILYNLAGLGIVYFLNKSIFDTKLTFRQFETHFNHEYRKSPLSNVFSLKYRSGLHLNSTLDLGIEFSQFAVFDNPVLQAYGITPFFTWHIINSNEVRISYDNGVGPMLFFETFPLGGTQFNFYTFYGLRIELKKWMKGVVIGFQNLHISNADIKGRERNPSFDGIGVHLAFKF